MMMKTIQRYASRALPLLFLALSLPDPAFALALERSPYIQSLSKDQVVIRWRTDTSSDTELRYGGSSSNLDQVKADGVQTREHEVRITGLSPGTRYFYSVGSSTTALAGGDADHYFVTAPTVGSARPVRIWAVGDSGTADSNARAVRDAYLGYRSSNPTDLFLMLGDNAYNSGRDYEYTQAVFDMYASTTRQTPLWPTIGNHDARTQQVYFDSFTLPTNAEAGGVASGTENYYSFDYANIHFVVLDSQLSDRSSNGAMLQWLEQDLSSTSQEWIIAFWHHPPYTKGSHDSDRESQLIDMRENALPILEQYGVDLVLTGHSHSYERSYLLNGHYGYSNSLTSSMKIDSGSGDPDTDGAYRKTDDKGAVYIVAGSSGKTSGGSLDHPAMYVSMNRLGSMAIDVNDKQLDARFIDNNGNVRDRFRIVKTSGGGGTPGNQAPTVDAGSDQSVNVNERLALSGTASDDGLPNPPGTLSYTWSQLSGPGTAAVDNVHALSTQVRFDQAGNYELQLEADDGEKQANDSLQVTVLSVNNNQPPQVDAGDDISDAVVNESVALSGSASDDGIPANPGQLTLSWSMRNGPGQVQFADASSAQTTATFSVAGSYVLRLNADDGELQAHDDLSVFVSDNGSLEGNSQGGSQLIIEPGQQVAQAFVHGDTADPQFNISRVTLYLARGDVPPNGALRFHIARDPDAPAMGGSQYEFNASNLGSSLEASEIDFSTPVGPLTAGETYYLVLENGADLGSYLVEVSGDEYPPGSSYLDGVEQTDDLRFRLDGANADNGDGIDDETSGGGLQPADILPLALLVLLAWVGGRRRRGMA